LAEGEHTIAFVSSIPFRFAVQSTVSWSFLSNPLCLLSLSVRFEPKVRRLPTTITAAPGFGHLPASLPPVSTSPDLLVFFSPFSSSVEPLKPQTAGDWNGLPRRFVRRPPLSEKEDELADLQIDPCVVL
jgi:hypothetical protein